jgi:hypothetical protein
MTGSPLPPLCTRLLAVILTLISSLWADGVIIHSVDVRGTRRPLVLETQAGEALDTARVSRDVHRLWATGWFSDVRVESTETPAGPDIVFHLTERPRFYLRRVEFEPKKEKQALGLEPGSPIDDFRAQKIANSIKTALVEDGYANAKVNAEVAPVGPDQADLRLRIEEGSQCRIREARFTGNTALPETDLRRALRATRVRRILFWKTHPPLTSGAVDADVARLQSFYLSRGYFDARVQQGPVQKEGELARVTYSIDSGPQYKTPEGVNFSAGALCRCLFQQRRESEKEGKLDFAARIEAEEIRDERLVHLTTSIDAGPAYTVGRIDFRGNHKFRDGTLRRAMLLDEGALFNLDLLRRSVVRLNRMNIFERIDENSVLIARQPSAGRANIVISVKEKRPGVWSISGPVGPPSIAGPLQATVASRLPAWGRGPFETSTYFATLSLVGFYRPLVKFLPYTLPKPFFPVLGIQRPFLPGQQWQSGFFLSPQLAPPAMLASYGIAQFRGRVTLGSSSTPPPVVAQVERTIRARQDAAPEPAEPRPLICEMPRSRWAPLRSAANFLLNLLPAYLVGL